MKVLGINGENYSRKYIVEIGHSELEEFLGKYYGKLDKLKAGEEVDLSVGMDFYKKTMDAVKTHRDFIQKNQEIVKILTDGFQILGRNEVEQ